MKKSRLILMCLAFLASVMVSSCSKDEDAIDPISQLPKGSLSVTLNGSGYNNVAMNFNVTGIALIESGFTACEFKDAQNNIAMVGFVGASTGTYVINDETSGDNNLIISLNNGTTIVGISMGNIVVTAFGTAGQEVVGTVSGTGFISVGGAEPTAIELKNCSFSATRLVK